MKITVHPYKMSSRGAKQLANALTKVMGYKVWRTKKPRPKPVYWGHPNGINANKLHTLQAFTEHGVSCPEYTRDASVARDWLKSGPVIARKLLCSAAGKGAIYLEKGAELVDAKLYLKYIPKKKEYRVHCWQGKVILVQEKRRRRGSSPDPKIRTHGDWVFCSKDIVEPADLREVGLGAAAAVSFSASGAVDVVWNEKKGKCFALEVNSAPGICPSTALIYANNIKESFDVSYY